jgi:hypothetical protein
VSAPTKPQAPRTPAADDAAQQLDGVSLGVVVSPKLERDVTSALLADLAEDLSRRFGSVGWRLEVEVDSLVNPPASLTEIFDAAREKLLEHDWDLGIVVTALPLRVGGRPVSRHPSPTHGIGVISMPALGALHLKQRLRRAVVDLVEELVGAAGDEPRGAGRRARAARRWERALLNELLRVTKHRPGGLRLLYVPVVVLGHLRLLLGMVRANRPWRFAARLYAALVAALAAGAYGVVTSDIWRLADANGVWRLTALSVGSLLVTIVVIIAAHGLWERTADPRVREQVVLFNIATTVTVTLGIATLYIALFAVILGATALVTPPSLLDRELGHGADFSDHASIAWFIASFAAIAGGLGASLESDEAVREAAYASSHPTADEA